MDIYTEIYKIYNSFIIFDIADTLMAIHLFLSISGSIRQFSKAHPIASLHLFMSSRVFGKVMLNFIVGKPVIDSVHNYSWLFLNFSVWYLSLFVPKEAFYKMISSPILKIPTIIVKEFQRVFTGIHTVKEILSFRPGYYLQAFILGGVIISSFRIIVIPFEQLYRGVTVSNHELKSVSLTTKLGFLISFSYVLFRYIKVVGFSMLPSLVQHMSEKMLTTFLIAICLGSQLSDNFLGYDPVSLIFDFLNSLVFAHNIPYIWNLFPKDSKSSHGPKHSSKVSSIENKEKGENSPSTRRRRTSKG